jgi:NAD(P)H-hydrate epimerase
MTYWVTPDEMSQFDRKTISSGTPGHELMERAGTRAAHIAMRMVSVSDGPVNIWVGPGNNGGDGFVVARHMRKQGYDTRVILAVQDARKLSPDCLRNLTRYQEEGGLIVPFARYGDLRAKPCLSVDALLGTGFKSRLKGIIRDCTELISGDRCPILAIDSPTGLNGLTGSVDPCTPRASVTVTFQAPKLGLLLPPGCGHTGSLVVVPIGIEVPENPLRAVVDLDSVREMLPARPVDAHKGTFGRLLLIGGSEGMPGAPQLMTMGALRSGVGLATLLVPYPAAPLVSGRIPEALCYYFLPGDVTSLPAPDGYDAVAVGPGLGAGEDTLKLVRYILENWSVPLVLDADALNVLEGSMKPLKAYGSEVILTPHPGELRRLTGCGEDVTEWFTAAEKLAASSGSTVLLKGKPSVVFSSDGNRFMIPSGNSGLATGGSGDVLTGMIGSFLAQGVDPVTAAILGSYLHGLSADLVASESSSRSLLPSDVSENLGNAFAMVETGLDDNIIHIEGNWKGRLWNC